MKSIKYILSSFVVAALVSSCYDMELQPKGMLDEGTLFSSQTGVQRYFADVYNDLPIEDFNYSMRIGYANPDHNDDGYWEGMKNSPATVAMETQGRIDGGTAAADFWKYNRVREINTFLQNIPLYKDNYTEPEYNALLGEAHFLRAYYYFGMAKRYGGVPIVDVVQDPTQEIDSLRVKRATEDETWMFIHDDLQFAMENASTDRSNTSRANRYAAAALMSRAMLYAASSAKYGAYSGIKGPATSAGLMSMSPDRAGVYYQYSYDACKFLQTAGFKLHTGANKETAYVEVFSNDNAADEDIFVKRFGPNTTTPYHMALSHSWNAMTLPKGTGMSADVGCALQPAWELIRLFQLPALVDENDEPVRFDNLSDIWDNNEIEARAKAVVYFPGMKEQVTGTVLDMQTGVYTSFPGYTVTQTTPDEATNAYTANRITANGKGVIQNIGGADVKVNGLYGYDGGDGDEGSSNSGTIIRKYVGTSADRGVNLYASHETWKTFRYGEILCNWAEAAYELGLIKSDEGLKQEAITHLNELRDRAGARPYTYVASPADIGTPIYGFAIDENLQFIRDERMRELCFENQTYFDQRRWRISNILYQSAIAHNLSGYYIADEGKYIFLPDINWEGRRISFNANQYYRNIPGDELNKNPNLVRNDGY